MVGYLREFFGHGRISRAPGRRRGACHTDFKVVQVASPTRRADANEEVQVNKGADLYHHAVSDGET